MTRTYRLLALALACAAPAACGPGQPEPSDSTGASSSTGDASSTSSTTDGPTSTAPTTTGDSIAKCVDAKTEGECVLATELDPNIDAGCRWAEVRVAVFPQEGMCMLTAVGGVCQLATADEGGPGCWGFFRETESGTVELVSFDCGSPVGGEWESCWDVPMDSPGFMPCACLNPEP